MADSFKPLPGLHVLVVEDNADSRYLLTDVLEYCGALVTSVSCADEARAILRRVRPDVLVSDLAMPGLDGYALMRWVRALPLRVPEHTRVASVVRSWLTPD